MYMNVSYNNVKANLKATVFKTPLVLKAKLRDFSIYKLEKSRFRIS